MKATKKSIKLYAESLFGVNYTPEKEKELIKLCIEPIKYPGGYHPSFAIQDRMELIDKVLGNFGVESLYPDVDLTYSNTGDTYATTIYYYNNRFNIGCWGDVAEKYIK